MIIRVVHFDDSERCNVADNIYLGDTWLPLKKQYKKNTLTLSFYIYTEIIL